MQVKTCKDCSQEKPVTEFSQIKQIYKGKVYINYQSYCKPCAATRYRRAYGQRTFIRKQTYTHLSTVHKTPEVLSREAAITLWPTMKQPTLPKLKTYPICTKGHKYVGKHCLPCKYSLQSTAKRF